MGILKKIDNELSKFFKTISYTFSDREDRAEKCLEYFRNHSIAICNEKTGEQVHSWEDMGKVRIGQIDLIKELGKEDKYCRSEFANKGFIPCVKDKSFVNAESAKVDLMKQNLFFYLDNDNKVIFSDTKIDSDYLPISAKRAIDLNCKLNNEFLLKEMVDDSVTCYNYQKVYVFSEQGDIIGLVDNSVHQEL